MLMNAMLLRIDDPAPAPPGDALALRCSAGAPSGAELGALEMMGLTATTVLYLPMELIRALPGGLAPAVNQRVTLQLDGCPAQTFTVLHTADRVGDVLSHVQVFLAE